MEIVPLIHKYGISLDQSKPADTAGVTMLCQSSKCNFRWNRIGVIHLVRTQHFPKNQYFLPPDTHTLEKSSKEGEKYIRTCHQILLLILGEFERKD